MSRKPTTKRMSATPSARTPERARGHPIERARAREVGQEQRSGADHHDDVGAGGRARHERLDLALGLAPRLERRRHVRQRADEVAAGRCWMASVETSTDSSREGRRSPRFSMARSNGCPMRISVRAICSSVRAGSSSSFTAIPYADTIDSPADAPLERMRASSGSWPRKGIAALLALALQPHREPDDHEPAGDGAGEVPDDERRRQVARDRAGQGDQRRLQGVQRHRGAVEAQLQAAARRRALEGRVEADPQAHRAQLGALAGGPLAQLLARRAGSEQVPRPGRGDGDRAREHEQPCLVSGHRLTRAGHPAPRSETHGPSRGRRGRAPEPRARRRPPRCRRRVRSRP